MQEKSPTLDQCAAADLSLHAQELESLEALDGDGITKNLAACGFVVTTIGIALT